MMGKLRCCRVVVHAAHLEGMGGGWVWVVGLLEDEEVLSW